MIRGIEKGLFLKNVAEASRSVLGFQTVGSVCDVRTLGLVTATNRTVTTTRGKSSLGLQRIVLVDQQGVSHLQNVRVEIWRLCCSVLLEVESIAMTVLNLYTRPGRDHIPTDAPRVSPSLLPASSSIIVNAISNHQDQPDGCRIQQSEYLMVRNVDPWTRPSLPYSGPSQSAVESVLAVWLRVAQFDGNPSGAVLYGNGEKADKFL